MRAIICSRYGPPESLRLVELPDPVPGPGELLIRVRATTVSAADSRIRALRMPSPLFSAIGRVGLGFTGPRRRVLGTEVAGTVEGVGAGVSRSRVGDKVVAVLGVRLGGHAELVRVRESGPVVRMPESLSFEQAVAVPFGALTALYFLRDIARVSPGQRILVVGASGSVGSAAVQIARDLGARVSAVCSTPNIETVRSLGAEKVIDYTHEDPWSRRAEFDAVFDAVGATTFARCREALTPSGVFLAAVMTGTEILQVLTTGWSKGRRVRSGVTPERPQDLSTVFDLVATGRLKPLLDRVYPFEEFVEAHRRVDSGRKVGSVVLSLTQRPGG